MAGGQQRRYLEKKTPGDGCHRAEEERELKQGDSDTKR
jgi:hypothetical protein